MNRPLSQRASVISQALVAIAKKSTLTATWNRNGEQTLHQLDCRDPHLLHRPLACDSGRLTMLENRIKEAESQKLQADPSGYSSMIGAYIKDRRTREAFMILHRCGSSIEIVGAEICNLVLAGLVSDGFFDSARKLFDEMLGTGLSFSTVSLGLFLSKYCRTAELCETLRLIDEFKQSFLDTNTSIIAILIIYELCKVGRMLEAYSALEELRSRGFKPDFMAYRIVTESFRSNGYIAEVHEVLKKKRKFGVAPRANDYREFIFDLISGGRIDEALELGEVIVSGNFPIEDDVLGYLIESASTINPLLAMIFFKYLIGRNKLPTLSTLNTLCGNLCRHGKLEELLNVFHVLSSKNYFTDVDSFRVMILHYCTASRVREAYDILRAMAKKGIDPDVSCYNILIEACCKEDLLRPAKRLWDEMFASGIDGNLKTYNILIKMLTEAGQVENAQTLLNHMLVKRVEPDADTFSPILECLCNDARIDTAIQIFHMAANKDKLLAHKISTPFILSLCKGGHFLTASKLLCGLLGGPNHSEPHAILLKCMAEARKFHIAIEHMKTVMDISPSLLEGICTELVALCSSCPNPDLILHLLQQMSRDHHISISCSQMDLPNKFYV